MRVLAVWGLLAVACQSPPEVIEPAVAAPPEHRERLASPGIGVLAKTIASRRPSWKYETASGVSVVVHEARWTWPEQSDRSGRIFRVDASLHVTEVPTARSTVWIKASCRKDDRALVSVAELRDDDWLLYEITDEHKGATTSVYQELFDRAGLDAALPCQIEFRVVPHDVGRLYRIAPTYCAYEWGVTPGRCTRWIDPPVAGDAKYSVAEWTVGEDHIGYLVTAGERFSQWHEVGLRVDCEEQEMRMFRNDLPWQWLDPGESFPVREYVMPSGDCSLSIERWRERAGVVSERVELGSACLVEGVLRPGGCAHTPAPALGSGPALMVHNEALSLVSTPEFSAVSLVVDVEAIREGAGTEVLAASAVCRQGKREWDQLLYESSYGTLDLRFLRVGDQVRRRFEGWVDGPVTSCEVVLEEGSHELGRWCVGRRGFKPCRS